MGQLCKSEAAFSEQETSLGFSSCSELNFPPKFVFVLANQDILLLSFVEWAWCLFCTRLKGIGPSRQEVWRTDEKRLWMPWMSTIALLQGASSYRVQNCLVVIVSSYFLMWQKWTCMGSWEIITLFQSWSFSGLQREWLYTMVKQCLCQK